MNVFDHPEFDNHEQIVFCNDKECSERKNKPPMISLEKSSIIPQRYVFLFFFPSRTYGPCIKSAVQSTLTCGASKALRGTGDWESKTILFVFRKFLRVTSVKVSGLIIPSETRFL